MSYLGRREPKEDNCISQVVIMAFLFRSPSAPEDGINSSFFPMAICFVKEETLALRSIYLESLYTRLDECINHILPSVGWYDSNMLTPVSYRFSYGGDSRDSLLSL